MSIIVILLIILMYYAVYHISEILPLIINQDKYDKLGMDILIVFATGWGMFNGAVGYLTVTYPLFLLIIYRQLYEELNSYFVLGRIRMSNYIRTIINRIVVYAFFSSLTLTLATLIFYSSLHFILPYKEEMLMESTGYITSFLFDESIFNGYPVFYFLLITVVNFLPVFFCYGLLYGALTLLTHTQRYYFYALPFVIMFLGMYIGNAIFEDYNYLSVSQIVYGYYSRFMEIWRYCVYPLAIAIVCFIIYYYRIHKGVFHYVKT